MSETTNFTLKEIQVRANQHDDWQTLSPDELRAVNSTITDYFRKSTILVGPKLDMTYTVPIRMVGFNLAALEDIRKRMADRMRNAIVQLVDKRIAEGRDIGAIIMAEEWRETLPGLEAQLAERDIRVAFMPYMVDKQSFYTVDREAMG